MSTRCCNKKETHVRFHMYKLERVFCAGKCLDLVTDHVDATVVGCVQLGKQGQHGAS
jgi:hypothetical protein